MDNEVLLILYENDLAQEEIASAFACSKSAVSQALKKLGVKKRYLKPRFANWHEKCIKCGADYTAHSANSSYCPSCGAEVKRMKKKVAKWLRHMEA